jgi:hypothetical protein
MSRIAWFVSFALFGLTLGQPMVAASLASEGRWTMLASGRDKVLLLTLQTNPESGSSGWVSREVKASDLRGVSSRQIENGYYAGTFEVVRDAGTFRCEGTIKHGKARASSCSCPIRAMRRSSLSVASAARTPRNSSTSRSTTSASS